MPAIWPATLPQYVLEQGYNEKLPEQTIETQVDGGLAKVRRRFTVASRLFQVTLQMTTEQAEDFETFFTDTLAGGSLTFEWVHPRYRTPAVFRFRKPAPQHQSIGSEYVRTTINLELLP